MLIAILLFLILIVIPGGIELLLGLLSLAFYLAILAAALLAGVWILALVFGG